MAGEAVSRKEYEALEGVVGTLVTTVEKLVTQINAKPVNSLQLEAPAAPVPAAAPKPFNIPDVGTVQLRFASFQVKGTKYTSEAVEADPALAAQLFADKPDLFTLINNK